MAVHGLWWRRGIPATRGCLGTADGGVEIDGGCAAWSFGTVRGYGEVGAAWIGDLCELETMGLCLGAAMVWIWDGIELACRLLQRLFGCRNW